MKPISPYHKPGFYEDALAKGRHRDIVGGRWDETGRIQMALLRGAGLLAHHRLLDIGCGSLRLGCKAVPYLARGNYWGTDLSAALMHHGREAEFDDPASLPADHLIADANFDFQGIPADIDFAIAFAVFTHLPMDHLRRALTHIHARFPSLQRLLFTVFLAPDAAQASASVRQPDGVVTHPHRAPYHFLAADIRALALNAGFECTAHDSRLPRGQVLFVATRSGQLD